MYAFGIVLKLNIETEIQIRPEKHPDFLAMLQEL